MGVALNYLLLLNLFVSGFSPVINQHCITPNGENATCSSLDSCTIIKNAVVTGNETALKFARQSECGLHNELKVCCGSTAFPIEKPPRITTLPDRTECGLETGDDRVIGGELTEIGDFPWMVLLGYTSNFSEGIEFKCGGTLINNRYVLTAAHCLRTNRRAGVILQTVRLGEWRISTEEDCNEDLANEECSDPVIDLKIERQIAHREYSRKTGNNDIALLKLEKNIRYTDFIRPICLPAFEKPSPEAGSFLILSGWGTTENGSLSDVKLQLIVSVVSTDVCAKKVIMHGQVTENQLCAGGESGKDACKGDSGGPLMGTYENTSPKVVQWYQEGVIAWGVGCGSKGFPGIYTRVAQYMNWILDNLE